MTYRSPGRSLRSAAFRCPLSYLVCCLVLAGCERRGQSDAGQTVSYAVKRQITIDFLGEVVQSQASAPQTELLTKYVLPAYRRAINMLSADPPPPLDKPVLLIAVFRPHRKEENAYVLDLVWIERAFETSGFYLRSGGTEPALARYPVFGWNDEDRRWHSAMLHRHLGLKVHLVGFGEPEEHDPESAEGVLVVYVHMASPAVVKQCQVGLILQDGSLTPSIPVWVDHAASTQPEMVAATRPVADQP